MRAHGLSQAPPHTIARYGIADALRGNETAPAMREAIGIDDQPNGVCRPRFSFCQDCGKVPLFLKLLRLLQSSYGRRAMAAHTGFHCAPASSAPRAKPAPKARPASRRRKPCRAGWSIATSALQRLHGNGGVAAHVARMAQVSLSTPGRTEGVRERGRTQKDERSQTASRVRCLSRRCLTMRRPARVDMRARKPCLRCRRRTFGWYVRFGILKNPSVLNLDSL